MKVYKKLLSIPMILCIIFSLTGCIIIPRYKHYDDIDAEKVSTIEIYGIHKSERITSSDVNADTLAYSLDENEFSDFLNKLSKIQFKDYILIVPGAVNPSFSYGNYVVKIKYNNGNYILISDGGFGESFDADGNEISSNHFGCDTEKWENLIFDYLPEEIINYSDATSNDETSIVDSSDVESETTVSSNPETSTIDNSKNEKENASTPTNTAPKKLKLTIKEATSKHNNDMDNYIHFSDSDTDYINYDLVINTNIQIDNFKFIELDESDSLVVVKTISAIGSFSPSKPIVIHTYLNDIMYNRGISFSYNDATKYYAIGVSMNDGSVELTEIFPD